MLKYRLTLGPVLIALLIGLAWFDQYLGDASDQQHAGVTIGIALALIIAAASIELAKMFRAAGSTTPTALHPVFALIGLLACWRPGQSGMPSVGAATAACVIVALLVLGRAAISKSNQGVIINLACALLTMAYLGFLSGMLMQLRLTYSAWALLGVLLLIKSCDIGAFAVGVSIGKHKLIPWVSPGKTWEGLIGGLVTSTGLGVLAASVTGGASFDPGVQLTLAQGAILGLICGFTGQMGDLAISMFKRDAGIKDSSAAVPGFGGVLDLLDSPLFAGAIAYWTLLLLTA